MTVRLYRRGIVGLFLALAWVAVATVALAQTTVNPTPWWATFYGTESYLSGALLPPGAVVEAYDPDGVLCGRASALFEGGYLLMIYGDDPYTPFDEGAEPGDPIALRINGTPATPRPPYDDTTWAADVLRRVELNTPAPPPEIPEASALALFGSGLASVGGWLAWRRRG